MSSEGSNASQPNREPQVVSSKGSSANLLQQMLEAALLDRKGELSESEWRSLRSVAADAHGRGLGMEDFVEALVTELLSTRFSSLKTDEATSKRLCRKIAVTLAADPHSRMRLQEFQQHLLRPQP